MNKKEIVSQNHDHFFRSAMSNKMVAKEFFERHLPNGIKQKIDFDSLQFCKDSYIDEELKLSEVDVLYKANFNNHNGYLYVLCEHQSYVDKFMAFRLLKYMIKIIDQHIKNQKDAKLPIIVPLVFYHGKVAYHGSTDLFDLFGSHKDMAKSLLLQPFKLIDVTKIPDNELKRSLFSGTMEFIFKHIFVRDILPYLEQISEQLRTLEKEAVNTDLLTVLLKYVILQGETEENNKVIGFIKQTFSDEISNKMTSIAGQFKQEGIQEGIQRGRQEGVVLGKIEIAANLGSVF